MELNKDRRVVEEGGESQGERGDGGKGREGEWWRRWDVRGDGGGRVGTGAGVRGGGESQGEMEEVRGKE